MAVLASSLHRDESETIALASEIGADVVIMDEEEGRELATRAGLAVTGVLGVLLRAKLQGQIPAVTPQIRALREKAGFFIAASLEAKVRSLAKE